MRRSRANDTRRSFVTSVIQEAGERIEHSRIMLVRDGKESYTPGLRIKSRVQRDRGAVVLGIAPTAMKNEQSCPHSGAEPKELFYRGPGRHR